MSKLIVCREPLMPLCRLQLQRRRLPRTRELQVFTFESARPVATRLALQVRVRKLLSVCWPVKVSGLEE